MFFDAGNTDSRMPESRDYCWIRTCNSIDLLGSSYYHIEFIQLTLIQEQFDIFDVIVFNKFAQNFFFTHRNDIFLEKVFYFVFACTIQSALVTQVIVQCKRIFLQDL